jgi:hypothetical protein
MPTQASVPRPLPPDEMTAIHLRRTELSQVARGYIQELALAMLLRGNEIPHPYYHLGRHTNRIRRGEIHAWDNFRERLVDAGYVLETLKHGSDHPRDWTFKLRVFVEVYP